MAALLALLALGLVLAQGSPQYYRGPPGAYTRPWLPNGPQGYPGGPQGGYPGGPASQFTRPWVPSFQMSQMRGGPPQENNYGSAQVAPTGNIQILPAYSTLSPFKDSSSQSLPPVQPTPMPSMYQAPGAENWWRKSYSPMPGNGNCFSQCKNRCGSYGGSYGGGYGGSYGGGYGGSYGGSNGCRPTCSTRCNIRPSCPSMNQGNWVYNDNTLFCGKRQSQYPSWLSQPTKGFNTLPGRSGYTTLSQQVSGGCSSGGCSDMAPAPYQQGPASYQPGPASYQQGPAGYQAPCNTGGCSDMGPASYQPHIQGPGFQTLPANIEFATEKEMNEENAETGSGEEE